MGEHGLHDDFIRPSCVAPLSFASVAAAADKLDYDFTRARDDTKDRNDYWDGTLKWNGEQACFYVSFVERESKERACWSEILVSSSKFYASMYIYL